VSRLAPQVFVETVSGRGDVVLALGGRTVRFGYLNDDDRHNLVVGGPGGWGAVLGFKDDYDRQKRYSYYDEDDYWREDIESWERSLRLALGWRGETAAGRLFEAGISGSLIQGEGDAEIVELDHGDLETYEVRWKAQHGLGFGIALRTLAAGGGLQAAVRFSYADLDPEDEEARLDPRIIRRQAGLDLGWRVDVGSLDDVVAGATVTWSNEETSSFYSLYTPVIQEESTDYRGALFFSIQERLRDDLVVRGGFRGPAYFSIDKQRRYRRDDQEIVVDDEHQESRGATQSPAVYLGVSWTWKELTVDGRVDTDLDLWSPLIGWAASWRF
jgi:hypothetical protein